MAAPSRPLVRWSLAVAVALAAAALYAPALDHAFLNYDDDLYITGNPALRLGLSPEGIHWAFTAVYGANWFPITWLSYLADFELHGLGSRGVHATNVVLHSLNAALLLLALIRLTGSVWRSALVAALFALHPLNVESVAWATERKGLLAATFWLLALWVHAGSPRDATSWPRVAAVTAAMTLGWMAKPVVVTLPFVLLLLDFWPLRRLSSGAGIDGRRVGIEGRRLWLRGLEKLPLLGVAAAASVVTFFAQRGAGVTVSMDLIPVGQRVANAVVSYVGYLGHLLAPVGLSAFYPHPEASLGAAEVGAAAAVLTALSLGAAIQWRRAPSLLVGWLWYLGALVPMIGLVQVGSQAMADRYAYLPTLGLLVALVFGVATAIGARPRARQAAWAAAVLLLLGLAATTRAQLEHWRDSVALFERSLDVTSDNAIGHHGLAQALAEAGRREEAIAHHREAIRLRPGYVEPLNNLAWLLATSAETTPREAQQSIRLALRASQLRPDEPAVLDTLAAAYAAAGQYAYAAQTAERALELAAGKAEISPGLQEAIAERARSYRSGRPFRLSSPGRTSP